MLLASLSLLFHAVSPFSPPYCTSLNEKLLYFWEVYNRAFYTFRVRHNQIKSLLLKASSCKLADTLLPSHRVYKRCIIYDRNRYYEAGSNHMVQLKEGGCWALDYPHWPRFTQHICAYLLLDVEHSAFSSNFERLLSIVVIFIWWIFAVNDIPFTHAFYIVNHPTWDRDFDSLSENRVLPLEAGTWELGLIRCGSVITAWNYPALTPHLP